MTEPSQKSSSSERPEGAATKEALEETPRAPSKSELQKAIVLIQHQLNNPLAALLAETQLLGLETTLGAEQRAATARITELTRRVISLVRDLDRLAEGPEAAQAEPAGPAADAGSR